MCMFGSTILPICCVTTSQEAAYGCSNQFQYHCCEGWDWVRTSGMDGGAGIRGSLDGIAGIHGGTLALRFEVMEAAC